MTPITKPIAPLVLGLAFLPGAAPQDDPAFRIARSADLANRMQRHGVPDVSDGFPLSAGQAMHATLRDTIQSELNNLAMSGQFGGS